MLLCLWGNACVVVAAFGFPVVQERIVGNVSPRVVKPIAMTPLLNASSKIPVREQPQMPMMVNHPSAALHDAAMNVVLTSVVEGNAF